MLVSVVIPNYNYEEFVGDAIDSALALDWPDVEVIVVDDGSTDRSREVIGRYGDRITAIFQPNSSHAAACNAGFARSRGDVIIFLDSDDFLDPSLIRELAAVWRPGISKVQFQMKIVDSSGRPTGALFPQFDSVPTPAQIRKWFMTTGAYPTPPCSGNAYPRSFLEKIFPLDVADRFSDSCCLAAAPYLGDVVTIDKPLVGYRVHGRNNGAMSSLDVGRFRVEVSRAQRRFRYAQGIARSVGLRVPDDAFYKSLAVLPYRLASYRLDPARHPIEGDGIFKIARDAVKASLSPQGRSLRAHAALVVWVGLVAVSPRPLGRRLVLWRLASPSRPKALTRVLRALRLVKHHESHAAN
jgi:glycosyltransferase involved in cell wall biosynthesis